MLPGRSRHGFRSGQTPRSHRRRRGADISSFVAATFECIDIIKRRALYDENHSNPLRKMSNAIIANATDEAIEVNEDER